MAFRWNLCSHAFCLRIFTKMCFSLPPEAHFWKPMLSKMLSKMLVLSHFWMHWPFQSPSVGPSSATKNRKKCCSREGLEHFFDLRPFFNHNLQFIFASSAICFNKFDFWCLLAWVFSIFLRILWKCAPRLRWEAHFRRTVFATIVCKRLFPYPNWLQNHHLWEGISALCCASYNMFLPSERKMAHFRSSVWHHFCSRMHFKANFHIFGLDFATFLGKLCWPSLLSPLAWQPSFFKWHARICRSQAVSASIICRAAVCPSLRAFNNFLLLFPMPDFNLIVLVISTKTYEMWIDHKLDDTSQISMPLYGKIVFVSSIQS